MTKLSGKILAIVVIVLLRAGLAGVAQAEPDYRVSCGQSGCHTRSRNAMTVTGYDTFTNLGYGSRKTFIVEPGSSVGLAVNVTNGDEKYAVALKDLHTGGVQQDPANRIVFTRDYAWVDFSYKSPPYYASTSSKHRWDGRARKFTFNLHLDSSAPPDFYELEFEVAGKNGGKWSQRERFYLQVLPAPGDGDIDGDGHVDFYDLAILAAYWMDTGCAFENDYCDWADINVDGAVNSLDLKELASDWLTQP